MYRYSQPNKRCPEIATQTHGKLSRFYNKDAAEDQEKKRCMMVEKISWQNYNLGPLWMTLNLISEDAG